MNRLSAGVSRGLSGTITRPALAMPAATSGYSIRLPSSTATRSPGRRPCESSQVPSRLARSSSAPKVSVRSPSMTAVAVGVARANSRIPPAIVIGAPPIAIPICPPEPRVRSNYIRYKNRGDGG